MLFVTAVIAPGGALAVTPADIAALEAEGETLAAEKAELREKIESLEYENMTVLAQKAMLDEQVALTQKEIENVNQKTTLTGLLARLYQLSDNTTDSRLLEALSSLLSKLGDLSPAVFAQLKQDTLMGQVLFPPDYTIGKFG